MAGCKTDLFPAQKFSKISPSVQTENSNHPLSSTENQHNQTGETTDLFVTKKQFFALRKQDF